MERQLAREAIRLLAQKRLKDLEKFQRDDPEIVHIATDIALGLERGEL
jgi:Mlc titration factor MtfA (ptsG expression regulator)